MSQANLSEILFKPRFKHPETSTLVRRFNAGTQPPVQSALDGKNIPHWYRMINRLMWIWRGVDPREILDVQARIVMSDAERTDADLYDTVIGYRGGNWIYEWAKQAMDWQQKACQETDPERSGRYWLHASTLYNIAAYPHLKGDDLAEQAQALSNRAYEEAAQRLPGTLREMEFSVPGGSPVTGFLHMPKGDGPFPTVLMCGGLDSMQTDYYTLYERYFAPRGIAMLTLDMPSIGFSSKWKLTQDSSLLHQHVLKALPNVPWVDHTRVAAFDLLITTEAPKMDEFSSQLLGYFTLALYTSAPSKLKGDLNYLRLEWGPDFQQHEAGLIGADEVPILTTSSAELAQQQIATLNGCTWLPVSWARKKGGLHTVVDSTTLSRPLYAIWLQNSDKNALIRDLLKINVLDEVY